MKRRNGYNGMEIVQKREALENVPVPYRPEEDKQLLRDAGFTKCYNFSGTIVLK
jgi:tRNA (cmo5U34)-methyltransferase